MKEMKFFLFLLVFFLFLDVSFSLTCRIVNNSCSFYEACLFSLYSTKNSHAGSCGYYSYNICCDQIYSYFNQSCNISTSPILSFYQMNNSHVAKGDYYNLKLCVGYLTYPIECEIRDSCYEDETCIVSLYSDVNSHVAECSCYPNKLCCKQLADLVVNSSSLRYEYEPVFGSLTRINITVWNDGDVNVYNVNVSCYENGVIFDSKIINVAKKSFNETYCDWVVSCNNNILIEIDPLNQIRELNESNNEISILVPIIEKLNVTILHPSNNSVFYRGEKIWLNSTVVSSCNATPYHNVYWYIENILLGSGDKIQWQIPLDDGSLGSKNVTAYANYSGYASSSSTVFITVLNNLPKVNVLTNVSEIESGDGIEINCQAYDLEDCYSSACNLIVNISILDPNGNWNNITANRIGNTFYRDYIAPYYPLGEYKAYCIVVDSDNGYVENFTTFVVWQGAVITINLNSTYYFWNSGVKIYGNVIRRDGSYVQISPIDVFLGNQKVCSKNTDMQGYYECEFVSPSQIGNYLVYVNVTDELTQRTFLNFTILRVKFVYGGEEKDIEKSRSVSCYEVPQLVVNPDGSIKRVYTKVCVW